MAQLEIKTAGKYKESSNCEQFDLHLLNDVDFDEELDQLIIQFPSSKKRSIAPKKKTLRSNAKTLRGKKAIAAEPSDDFSSKIKICNEVSDVVKSKNKTIDSDEKLLNYKTFDLHDTEKKIAFDEMSKQTSVESVSSNELIVSQKKRTCTSTRTTSKEKTTRKKKTDLLTDFSSKIEFSNYVEPENKTNKEVDEKFEKTVVQSLSNKLTVSEKKRTCKFNFITKEKRKADPKFFTITDFYRGVLDAIQHKDKVINIKNKSFDLLDDKKEFDFDEKSKQNIITFPSKKLRTAQKKRTCRSDIKPTRKRKPTETNSSDFSSKSKFCNEVPDAVEAENEITDSNKKSNFKTFDLLDAEKSEQTITEHVSSNKHIVSQKKITVSLTDIKKKFDGKPSQITVKSLSSNKLADKLSKSNSSQNFNYYLSSIIEKVRSLQIHHLHSITPEGIGLSAIDVSPNLSHLAYSFPHSHEVHLCSQKSLSDDIARNDLRSTCETGKKEYLSSPQEYTFRHNDDVSGLCFSSNNKVLLSCSLDKSVKAISTISYEILSEYTGYGPFTDIDINTRRTQFATANILEWYPYDVLYVYDFNRKIPVTSFIGHLNSLKCVRFHPNGLYVASAAADNCIKLWCIHQNKEVRNFKDEGTDNPEKITFSPDGKYIASTHSGCVKIWDLAEGRKIKCLETSASEPSSLNICYNYSGNILAAGGSDKKINVWNVTSGKSLGVNLPPNYDLLMSESVGKRIFSIKFAANFFSYVTN